MRQEPLRLAWCSLVALVVFATNCLAVQVGQSEAQVLKELGEPGMKTPLGPKGVIWAYRHGDLVMKGGRVTTVNFRTQEQIATVEREERIARERANAERLAEGIEREKAAEAQARRLALDSRSLAFGQRRAAVLFNALQPVDGISPGGGGVTSAVFTYGKTEESFVDTGGGGAFGDSRQSVGGGGGVGLSGRAGYVIPSIEYVSLWLVVEKGGPQLPVDLVAKVTFTNRLMAGQVSYRVRFSPVEALRGDAPGCCRYRADIQIADDNLPGEVFARSDGISISILSSGPGGEAGESRWSAVSNLPAAPRR